MIRIKVDDGILRQIREAGTPVQLCDSAGNDVAVAWTGLSKYAGLHEEPLPDEAEIRQILAEKPSYNIDEVLAWMQKQ